MYDQPANNWDFETADLSGWTATGTAFLSQPVYGNCIESAQVHAISLGGDYWQMPLFTRGHINVDHFQFLDYPPRPYHAPVWGFADLHCHPLAHLAYGGSLIWGKPDDDASTLRFCDGAGHGGGPISAQIIHTIESNSNTIYPPRRHASGPWPHFTSRTHQEMHVDWIKRAYEGGLRILCASALHNQLLEALSHARPFHRHQPEDDMSVALRQIENLHEMANTHHKWMQVATSATSARQIIASNKVALVPALEVDFLGNWRKEEDCSTEQISALLHDLFTQGVRMITPLHLVDNAFGGCAVYDNLFNSLNYSFHGTFYEVEDGQQSGVFYRLSEQPTIVRFGWLAPRLLQSSKPLPAYQGVPAGHGHVNRKGLTCRGRDLLHEMMRLGMIIDVTHMSEKTLNETLDLVEGYQYPVVASHVAPRELGITASEVLLTRHQLERIQRLSGMIGLGTGRSDVHAAEMALPQLNHTIANTCAGSSRSWAQTYLYTLAVMPGAGVALGTDFNGMVIQSGPRFGPHVTSSAALLHHSRPELPFQPQGDGVMYNDSEYATPLTYAQLRTTCPPLTASPSSAHDINIDGLAHYGMLPDFLQDVRNIGVTPEELAPLFHSAEFFLRLWETCEQKSRTI